MSPQCPRGRAVALGTSSVCVCVRVGNEAPDTWLPYTPGKQVCNHRSSEQYRMLPWVHCYSSYRMFPGQLKGVCVGNGGGGAVGGALLVRCVVFCLLRGALRGFWRFGGWFSGAGPHTTSFCAVREHDCVLAPVRGRYAACRRKYRQIGFQRCMHVATAVLLGLQHTHGNSGRVGVHGMQRSDNRGMHVQRAHYGGTPAWAWARYGGGGGGGPKMGRSILPFVNFTFSHDEIWVQEGGGGVKGGGLLLWSSAGLIHPSGGGGLAQGLGGGGGLLVANLNIGSRVESCRECGADGGHPVSRVPGPIELETSPAPAPRGRRCGGPSSGERGRPWAQRWGFACSPGNREAYSSSDQTIAAQKGLLPPLSWTSPKTGVAWPRRALWKVLPWVSSPTWDLDLQPSGQGLAIGGGGGGRMRRGGTHFWRALAALDLPPQGGGGGSAQEAPTHSPADQHKGNYFGKFFPEI